MPKSWEGKTVLELDIRKKYKVNIMAIKREDSWYMTITPQIKFEKDQDILVYGANKHLEKFLHFDSSNFATEEEAKDND